jgi:hypothetical protein
MHEAIVCNSFVVGELHNTKGTTAKEERKKEERRQINAPLER